MTAFLPIMVLVKVETGGRETVQMRPFDNERIVPYAYRHTYAQRHADARVAVDVLRDLMNHRQLDASQRYCRVGSNVAERPVERVATVQFDRHGNRVWRTARAMPGLRVHPAALSARSPSPTGAAASLPTSPAGGGDCTIRFRCVGCGHFGRDISYLPVLNATSPELLRHCERLAATLDADEWATTEVVPSGEQIERIRRRIAA